MADRSLSKKSPTITIERGEFEHFVRAMEGIRSRAQNLLVISEVLESRADTEYRKSLAIITELDPEGGVA